MEINSTWLAHDFCLSNTLFKDKNTLFINNYKQKLISFLFLFLFFPALSLSHAYRVTGTDPMISAKQNIYTILYRTHSNSIFSMWFFILKGTIEEGCNYRMAFCYHGAYEYLYDFIKLILSLHMVYDVVSTILYMM